MPLTCRARSSIVRMVMGSNFFMGRFIFWFCSGLVPFFREFLRLPNAREMSRRFTIKNHREAGERKGIDRSPARRLREALGTFPQAAVPLQPCSSTMSDHR